MELLQDFLSIVEKISKDFQGTNAFERSGWIPFNDSAADVVGVGFKTARTTLSQIDGVRLSETKGAHNS